jgi:hypothetical protein
MSVGVQRVNEWVQELRMLHLCGIFKLIEIKIVCLAYVVNVSG